MSTNVTETLQFNCTTCPSECLSLIHICICSRRILCNLGKREQFARIMSSVERYKNLYLFAQQKKPL